MRGKVGGGGGGGGGGRGRGGGGGGGGKGGGRGGGYKGSRGELAGFDGLTGKACDRLSHRRSCFEKISRKGGSRKNPKAQRK